MNKSKFLVLGYFGYRTNQLDGQTVKTRDLFRLLEENNMDPDFYDTQELQYGRISIINLIKAVLNCATLIYLPAQNNLRLIFPLIFILSKVCKFRIHYFVIGGWLTEFVSHKPIHRYMLKHVEGIHSETLQMKNELEQHYCFRNIDVFPNFRFFSFKPTIYHERSRLNLVFMARINKMKGIDMIFSLGQYIVTNKLENNVTITFYGPILQQDKRYFEEELVKYPFMCYNGILQPTLIHSTLQKYDALILPTHYFTEGLPGSIVDSYISGIPVIVTAWKHSHEFVEDGKTGIVIPFFNGQNALNDAIVSLLNNESYLASLKKNALIRSNLFSQHVAWRRLREIL